MEEKNEMSIPKLNDDEVFVFMGKSSKSLIVEIIADKESIDLTELALIKFFEKTGLTFKNRRDE